MINDIKLFGFFTQVLKRSLTILAALSVSVILGLVPFAVIAVDDYVAAPSETQARSPAPSPRVAGAASEDFSTDEAEDACFNELLCINDAGILVGDFRVGAIVASNTHTLLPRNYYCAQVSKLTSGCR